MERFLAALTAFVLMAPAHAADWHHPLYLSGGGYWRQRIPVVVQNTGDQDAAGAPVAVGIGTGPGEADLAGQEARSVRVCREDGVELLFSIQAPDGRPVTGGPIPEGGSLILPAECPPGGSATYYVYSDNPDAWAVPDFLDASLGVRNGGAEEGEGGTPTGWRHDGGDGPHRATWTDEDARSGARCLRIEVDPGAEPTWIATRQRGIHIIGGADYEMRAWVRARDVEGFAGWYIHVGNAGNPMIVAPMLTAGDGTFDWKEVTASFTAPAEANVAALGTVLRGTGTAWFDDVALTCTTPPKLRATAGKPEQMVLHEIGPSAADPVATGATSGVRVHVMNLSDRDVEDAFVVADVTRPLSRMVPRPSGLSFTSADMPGGADCFLLGTLALLRTDMPASTRKSVLLVPKAADGAGAASVVGDAANLATNPVFDDGAELPDAWAGGAEGQRPADVEMGFGEPGYIGDRCLRMSVPENPDNAWVGWRQDVPVVAGRTYLYGAWVKCEDVAGSVRIHAHYRNADGELCETLKHTGAGPDITGTTDWTLMSGTFTMPPDCTTFQLHLTMNASGTVWHDAVLLAEVIPAETGQMTTTRWAWPDVVAWPVNPVAKVFLDDVPRTDLPDARISCARNEKEPLQLAVRSKDDLAGVRVEVEAPANGDGATLNDVEIGVVGYVPIDYPTNYYSSQAPEWHRMVPISAPGTDGWAGMWPDPLLPTDTFDLAADTTQPVWVTVAVPKDARAGDYAGAVVLRQGDRTVARVPFTVHVWDFTLPDETHLKAVYDLRINERWDLPGKTRAEVREQFWRFMAERRVCPDGIKPEPVMRYVDGKVEADFTEFDRAATIYFDELGLTHSYTPWQFYSFGWGHPPATRFGEAPYEGESPFADADRLTLRPEYKRAYQACLRAYWEHVKEKGWADRITLYVSDEPHYRYQDVLDQMKAVCDMIHEVDPDIPIYSSTWGHRPEWDGYLDVWGVGIHGSVPLTKMRELQAAGDTLWFTTDGHMCTDTPYCAVERLLPYYCFQFGVEAYEFWGLTWLTYDPYEFGWHSYINQSSRPGESSWVRYPNGDGFLAYPGAPVGHDGPVSSIRLEQAREGMEDYEYLCMLRALITEAEAAGRDATQATEALARAAELVSIPGPNGRYSTEILPDPDVVFEVRRALAEAIELLSP